MTEGGDGGGGAGGDERDWAIWLRLLSHSVRDTSVSASTDDTAVLQAVRKLHELCKIGGGGDLVARVYPPLTKLFQRCCASVVSSQRSSTGLLLLTILQFFLDFGEFVLHDGDPSLRTFFRSFLSRQYADPIVAAATIDFLNQNKTKLLLAHATLLPQYFPLLLKVVAWGSNSLDKPFLELLPALMGPSSFLPLFPALLDLPALVLALEKLESRSGSAPGASTAPNKKSPAPEALLALMDEAYTGSAIADVGAEPGDDGQPSARDEADALCSELLRDENEGLAERHWSYPGMAAALQSLMGSVQSQRLQHALSLTPSLLSVYFAVALRDVNDSLMSALLPFVFARVDAMFPDPKFSLECRNFLLEFVLAAFHQSPHFIAVLKKPIMDRIGQPYTSTAKTELALQLCWAVGEHGGGGLAHKAAARELFETLELLLYENLSSRRMTTMKADLEQKDEGALIAVASQSRLLCFVVTAIAKLATCHRELSPRARVCLAKVARSHQVLDKSVWRRARDYLGLMHEPAICSSVLGPSTGYLNRPGSVQWSQGGTKAVASIPFYLLGGNEGAPFHNFSLSDVLGTTPT